MKLPARRGVRRYVASTEVLIDPFTILVCEELPPLVMEKSGRGGKIGSLGSRRCPEMDTVRKIWSSRVASVLSTQALTSKALDSAAVPATRRARARVRKRRILR